MQLIKLAPRSTAALDGASAQAALAGVIGAVGEPDFSESALRELNGWMPLCWWSIYTLYDAAPPALHAHAAVGDAPDGTAASWRVYRSSLYRRDATFSAARSAVAGEQIAMVHWKAAEIPSDHRDAIYRPHGLRERLSIVSGSAREGLLAINLYRLHEQPALEGEAIEAIARMAPPLLACVRKHIALREREAAVEGTDVLVSLTERERQVCERLLKGWTQEGIAVDLGLTPATVKTYRERAFQRLGIRSRHELMARATVAVVPRA